MGSDWIMRTGVSEYEEGGWREGEKNSERMRERERIFQIFPLFFLSYENTQIFPESDYVPVIQIQITSNIIFHYGNNFIKCL